MSAQDLIVAHDFLPIDCVDSLIYINFNYPDIFKENPKGIYIVGKIDPVLTDGEYYYTKSGLDKGIPIQNIDTVNEDVYNSKGKIVINEFIMRNKRKFLKNNSSYSYYGIKAIRAYVNKIIENNSAYIVNRRYLDSFINCFKPEFQKPILNQEIDIDFLLNQLSEQVYKFIEKEPWTIYLTKQLGSICLIQKTIDYRIYDWTLQKEKQEEEEYSLKQERKTTRSIKVIDYR
jgi:hypothetical protein